MSISIKLVPEQQEQLTQQNLLNSDLYFKSKQKLTLKRGKFCLFEHFDENPLFISNFGMGSKLKRYLLTQSKQVDEKVFDDAPFVGPYGIMVKRSN